jgi:hypothetical protein
MPDPIIPDQPMDTAPHDQTVIEVLLPNGTITRAIWAWGGGWAGEWDRRRAHGFGGWHCFNDAHQPIAWRHCGGVNLNA